MGPQHQANAAASSGCTTKSLPSGRCSRPTVGLGAPSPCRMGEGQRRRGRNRTRAPVGLPGVGAVAPSEGSMCNAGKVCVPAKTRPHGKDPAYSQVAGRARRLAAEAVRAMTGRTTQPSPSKGPLGERGRGRGDGPGDLLPRELLAPRPSGRVGRRSLARRRRRANSQATSRVEGADRCAHRSVAGEERHR